MPTEDQSDLFGGAPSEAGQAPEEHAAGGGRDLLRRWLALAKPFQAVGKVNIDKAAGLDDLEGTLAKVPSTDTLRRAAEELRQRTESWLQRERKARREAFGRTEAELIHELRSSGEPLRELDSSWRIGPLELQVRRESGQARALYNREQVVKWTPIASTTDLRTLLRKARADLERVAIPESTWVEVLWTSYENLAGQSRATGINAAPRVHLRDLFRECRVELVRRELATGRPEQKLRFSEFPLWVYLYNLDVYRGLGSNLPAGRRLSFETGSQRESQANGLVLNGLDPTQDYKVYCYVHA